MENHLISILFRWFQLSDLPFLALASLNFFLLRASPSQVARSFKLKPLQISIEFCFSIIYLFLFFCRLVAFVLFDPAGLSKTVWTLLRHPSLRPLESVPWLPQLLLPPLEPYNISWWDSCPPSGICPRSPLCRLLFPSIHLSFFIILKQVKGRDSPVSEYLIKSSSESSNDSHRQPRANHRRVEVSEHCLFIVFCFFHARPPCMACAMLTRLTALTMRSQRKRRVWPVGPWLS